MSSRITAIDLQNFQSHTRTRIPVGDFTVLMGLSSSGKTTVFRAMQFLFYGHWDSTYPKDDKVATAVAVEFDNGTRIIRMRKGNVNSAAIRTADGVTKFKSFGSVIPGLENIINVKPIEVGGKSINLNFSMQDDSIFMVSESKPVKAQWLGRLYGAHVINEMLKLMAKDKTRADGKRKDSEERLAKYNEELLQYNNMAEHEAAVVECEGLVAQLKDLKKVYDAREMLRQEKAAIAQDSWVLSVDLKSVRGDLGKLSVLKMLAAKKAELDEDREFIKTNSILLKTDLSKMRKGIQVMENINKITERLAAVRSSRADLCMRLSELDLEIASKKDDLSAVLVDGKCPACGNEVGADRAMDIAENIKRLL